MKGERIVGLSNAVPTDTQAARRVLRIPFGQHPHPDGTVQQVNAATAGKIVAALRTRLANGLDAPLVYRGHPDRGANIPDDTSEYGRVTDASVESGALALVASLTNAGIALVRAGKRWFSPHWLAFVRDGVSAPFELLSVGLTETPVIPVSAIANQQQPREGRKGGPMRDKLLALLKTRGVELAADANDDAIVEAYQGEFGKAATQANDLAAKDAEVVSLKGEAEAAKTKEVATAAALANERTERRKTLLDQALADGRVPPAARAAWEAEFDKDFAGTVVKLANARPVIKTAGRTDGDGGRQPGQDGIARILALVNEEMKATGTDYDAAFGRVRARRPELFGKAK